MPYGEASPGAGRRAEWERRVRRASALAERYPYAGQVLNLYRDVLAFQHDIYTQICSAAPPTPAGGSLREQLDTRVSAQAWPELISVIETRGTAQLAREAKELRCQTPPQLEHIMTEYLAAGAGADYSFFARVLLQPYAEWMAAAYPLPAAGSAGGACPVCGSRPQAAVLRPEGDGAKRFLLCSLCLTEWDFRRVLCPVCGEADHQKLPRYSAEDTVAVRVEACDTCHNYLKSVDLTVDGLAVPLVDEVATVALDVWAAEHDHRKAVPNLMGF